MDKKYQYSAEDTIKKISELAKEQPVYAMFEKSAEKFFNNVEYPASTKTKWQDKYSEHSLSLGDTINDSHTALKVLKRYFRIESKIFDTKYEEAINGDGQEWKRITNMKSSSLLSLLCFYNIGNNIGKLKIDTPKGIVEVNSSQFEVKNKVSGSHHSNIDVVLKGHYQHKEDSNVSILLECKFSEYLNCGKCSGISTEVYSCIYDELSDTLMDMGLKRVDDKPNDKGETAFSLTSTEGRCHHYTKGIKQMISHYLGVQSYLNEEEHQNEDVFLAEILFDFEDSQNSKLKDYESLYSKLAKGINEINQNARFMMLESSFTYQNLLRGYPLDNKVKEFYSM